MYSSLLFCVTALAVACGATSDSSTRLNCQELIIPVDVSAMNYALPSNLTIANLTLQFVQSVQNMNTTLIKGTYNIGARYCEPLENEPSRQHTLQLLVHGATYTRDYWSGLAAPGTKPGQDRYSWILYAAERGYPTLSIDRLCNGLSSHPNGVTDCQLPLEAETVHALITMARNGELPGAKKGNVFKKIILVGHSLGSNLADAFVVKHPKDVDALILTGFSFNISNAFPGIGRLEVQPAAQVDPKRFGGFGPSYVTPTNNTGTENFFFYGKFTQALFNYNYAHRGTLTVGELATTFLGQQAVPAYRGELFVLDGNEDEAFCETSPENSAADKPGNCSAGFDQFDRRSFPNVSGFGYFNTPDTGHCLNLHLTAQKSYAAAHQFLARTGF